MGKPAKRRKELTQREMASRGGIARKARMSPEARSANARKAAQARWAKKPGAE